MKAATLVALALLAALCTGSQYQNRRINDNDNNDDESQQQQRQAQPFQAGYEYSFVYNGQVASGLEVSGPNKEPASSDEPQQKAVTRIRAEAKMAFESEQRVTLQLERITIGQLNDQIDSPQQVQPMAMFEQKQIEESKLRKLQLPCQFEYNQGVVERIQFHAEDAAWSKNIKRGVLNLIQLNLQKQQVFGSQQSQQWASDSDEQQQDEQQQDSQSPFQSFTLPEITIEGDCLTTYTVSKQQNRQRYNDEEQFQERQQQQQSSGSQYFNVTKTVDFKKCQKIADVAYGYQNQQQQPQCQKCKQLQQQQQQQQRQQTYGPQQSQTCPEECDPKEIKSQQLHRSTTIRFVLSGSDPKQQYGIKRAELLSQYVYNTLRSDSTTMRTVVVSELIFRSKSQSKQQQQRHSFQPEQSNSQKDTLLYDNEWDVEEKRFYMNGDKEFNRENSPFASVPNKEEQILKIIRKVTEDATDKLNGLESRIASKLHRAIELLRMCRVSELKQIQQQVSEISQSSQVVQKKAQQTLADCLALAGTQNTIQVLTEMIRDQTLKEKEAVQALRQLTNLPAPSDKQAETVLQTCKEQAVQRSKGLKQVCWLTFGSMVGELCQQRTQAGQKSVPIFGAQSGYSSSRQCSSAHKETFKQALLEQYEQAQNIYEKILALKALGNAGIDTTVQSLEKIINSPQEGQIIRAQAIDALRRLRTQMPRKIQRILLPVVQNSREHPSVRISALAMILYTTPEGAILDQVAYTLNKERNPQMQAFAHTALQLLSKSKVSTHQQMARHLQNILQLSDVDEQALKAIRLYNIPIFSEEQKEGVFVSLVSAFSQRSNILPTHLAVFMNTLINDQFDANAMKVGLTQQGLEQWYEGLIQSLLKGQSRSQQTTRGQRSSSNPRQENEGELRKIFTGLSVKTRQSAYQQDDQEDDEESEQGQRRSQKQPFAMLTTRVGDVDTVILPIDAKSMPQCLKPLIQGQKISFADCLEAMQSPVHFNTMTAMNLIEKSAKVPTSLGLPLRLLQTMPVLASVEGQIRTNPGSGIKTQVKVHAIVAAVHMQKMEIWTPMITTGVEVHRAVELNLPVEAEIETKQGALQLAMKLPKSQTRLFGLHTLPHTYALDFDSRSHLLKESEVKTIQMPQFERFQKDINEVIGNQHFEELFSVQGHVHRPSNPTDIKQLLQHSMCTENHVHIKYESKSAAEEIIFRAQLSSFDKDSSMRPSINIYKKQNEFDLMDDREFERSHSHDQRRSKLDAFQSKFQSQMYKHKLTLSMETKGSRNQQQQKAQIDATAGCDSKFQFCKVKLDVQRPPLFSSENKEWTFQSEMQIMMPQAVSNVQKMEQSKFQNVAVEGNVEWGSAQKQSINFQLNGENAKPKEWREQIEQLQGPQRKFYEKQGAFINKFDLVAEYSLNPQTQMTLYECFEYAKIYSGAGYWNTDVQYQQQQGQQQQRQQGRQSQQGKVQGSVVIDPVTMQHATVIVKMPTQVVRSENVQLPAKVRPFALVSPQQKSIHSVSQLMSRYAVGSGRAECSVDGKRVETFDDVQYKAPIGKCYSVLAKDCSNDQQPQFAVLMKTLSNGKDKKIKVITPDQRIECKPTESSQKKLECTVNGQTVQPNDNQQQDDSQQQDNDYSQVVQYNNDEQTDVTINVEGVQVRFGCWGSNGCKDQKAWIKLSSQYKEGQCGLCGHYDDQADDNEWRMANGKKTQDMQQFHRSYSMSNQGGQDDDCSAQDQNDFYSQQNSRKFQQIGWNSQQDDNQDDDDNDFADSQRSRKNNQKYNNDDDWSQQQNDDDNDDEEDSQWQAGAYHTEGSSSEEDQWGRQGSQKRRQMSVLKKKNSQKGRQGNQQDDSEEPSQATKVLEYGHNVCFSHQPVKKCPQGTQPEDETSRKVKFVCLPRSKPETRRMQQQARRGQIVDTSSHQPTTMESIQEPARCTVY